MYSTLHTDIIHQNLFAQIKPTTLSANLMPPRLSYHLPSQSRYGHHTRRLNELIWLRRNAIKVGPFWLEITGFTAMIPFTINESSWEATRHPTRPSHTLSGKSIGGSYGIRHQSTSCRIELVLTISIVFVQKYSTCKLQPSSKPSGVQPSWQSFYYLCYHTLYESSPHHYCFQNSTIDSNYVLYILLIQFTKTTFKVGEYVLRSMYSTIQLAPFPFPITVSGTSHQRRSGFETLPFEGFPIQIDHYLLVL